MIYYLGLAASFAAAGAALGAFVAKRRLPGAMLGAVFGIVAFGLFLIAARPVFT